LRGSVLVNFALIGSGLEQGTGESSHPYTWATRIYFGTGLVVKRFGQSFFFGLHGLLIITIHSNAEANVFSSGPAAIPRTKDRRNISAI
jgi:hypothetical protein